MQKHSDEALVAYLDGELDSAERRHVEAWLDADPAARDRLAGAGAIDRTGAQRLCRYRQRAAARAADRGGARRDRGDRPARRPRSWSCTAAARRPRRCRVAAGGIGIAAAAALFGLVVRRRRHLCRHRPAQLRQPGGRAAARRGDRKQHLARQRRRLLQAGRQRRRQHAGRCAGQQRHAARRCRRSARACRSRCACRI